MTRCRAMGLRPTEVGLDVVTDQKSVRGSEEERMHLKRKERE